MSEILVRLFCFLREIRVTPESTYPKTTNLWSKNQCLIWIFLFMNTHLECLKLSKNAWNYSSTPNFRKKNCVTWCVWYISHASEENFEYVQLYIDGWVGRHRVYYKISSPVESARKLSYLYQTLIKWRQRLLMIYVVVVPTTIAM